MAFSHMMKIRSFAMLVGAFLFVATCSLSAGIPNPGYNGIFNQEKFNEYVAAGKLEPNQLEIDEKSGVQAHTVAENGELIYWFSRDNLGAGSGQGRGANGSSTGTQPSTPPVTVATSGSTPLPTIKTNRRASNSSRSSISSGYIRINLRRPDGSSVQSSTQARAMLRTPTVSPSVPQGQ